MTRATKTAPKKRAPNARPDAEVSELRARLAETEATLRAIRTGEVDTVLVAGKRGRVSSRCKEQSTPTGC
jgi:hypothetical protein